jgi:uncharacterized membrane protein (DUF485 family)
MDPQHRADVAHVDWTAAARSPEFRELVRRRRAFVVPATVFFLGWFLTFVLLAGYAPDFMGESVYEGLTVGYVLALSQFVMTWVLAWVYIRRSDRIFDPLAYRAAQVARDTGRRPAPPRPPGGGVAEPVPPGTEPTGTVTRERRLS